MRPKSLILFDRVFLGSLVLGAINSVASFSTINSALELDPASARVGLGGGFVMGTMLFSVGITLLLWYFISRRASNVAKWILTIFTVIGVLMLPSSLSNPMFSPVMVAMSILLTAMQVFAIFCLFRRDARDWFLGKGSVDPDVFS